MRFCTATSVSQEMVVDGVFEGDIEINGASQNA
jgi:hypothetical protein